MPDTFAITVIFIVLSTVIGAFVKGRSRDRCLKSLSGYPVTLERKDGKRVWGQLHVENSGLELSYYEPYLDVKDNHIETSYVLYKNEYSEIRALICYVDDLDPKLKSSRLKIFKKTRHPGLCHILMRKVRNIFGTVRDSIMEAVNLFMGRVKTATPAGKMLQGQDKYTANIQQQLIAATGTSYEPILERYIGKRIILALIEDDKKKEYSGILKDYTPEFITVLDAEYMGAGSESPRKADVVIPRASGIIRHAGE